MPARIRLQRQGRKKKPFYYIVVADSRVPRDGKFIERLGSYNPETVPASIDIDRDKALNWLQKGAQPSHTVRAILSYKGILYKKHLQRGVAKGILSQDEADQKFNDWLEKHEEKVSHKRQEHEEAKKSEFRKKEEADAAKRKQQEQQAAREASAEEADTQQEQQEAETATEEKEGNKQQQETAASSEKTSSSDEQTQSQQPDQEQGEQQEAAESATETDEAQEEGKKEDQKGE